MAMPSSRQVRMTRTAISPRLAITTLLSTKRHSDSVLVAERVRAAWPASTRFTDIESLDVDRLDQPASWPSGPRPALPKAWSWPPSCRPRGGAAWTVPGRPNRGPPCWSRSCCVRPDLPVSRWHLLTAAAGLAARGPAGRWAASPRISSGRTICWSGTASWRASWREATGRRRGRAWGCNVHGAPPGAAWVDEAAGRRVDRADLLAAWLAALDGCLGRWDDGLALP